MAVLEVTAYCSTPDFPLALVLPSFTPQPSDDDLNFVFTVGRELASRLSVFPTSPPDFTLLNFAQHKGYREFLKHIAIHLATTTDGKVYIPFPGLSAACGPLQSVDPSLESILLRKLQQAERADYASAAISGNYISAPEKELYPEAEFAIFHMQNYEPWPGLGNALFLGAFATFGQNWAHYNISSSEFPSDAALQAKKGVIITGAKYSAYDSSLPWISEYMTLLRRMYTDFPKIRIVGICFGCQVMASALGGATIKSPDYRFLYTVETVHLNLAFSRDFPSFPLTTIAATECHGDIVSRLPPDAVLYGHSNSAPVEVWGLPGRVLCFQGHPDLCPRFLQYFHVDYLRTRDNLMAKTRYHELIEEFRTRPSNIDEMRALIKAFLQP